MLKQLPFKKEYILYIGSILLLIVCYKLAFKETYEAWEINNKLKSQLQQNSDISYQPQYLERKYNNLNKVIDLYKTDTVSYRNNSISTISILAEKENIKLNAAPLQDPIYNTNKFIIQKLDFEGDFFSLTKVLDQLQQNNNIGFVRSLEYKLINNQGNDNAGKLILEVYLEIIK